MYSPHIGAVSQESSPSINTRLRIMRCTFSLAQALALQRIPNYTLQLRSCWQQHWGNAIGLAESEVSVEVFRLNQQVYSSPDEGRSPAKHPPTPEERVHSQPSLCDLVTCILTCHWCFLLVSNEPIRTKTAESIFKSIQNASTRSEERITESQNILSWKGLIRTIESNSMFPLTLLVLHMRALQGSCSLLTP